MRVGAYEVVSEVGRGGMGIVYLGRSADGREVAVKVLKQGALPDELERFLREQRLQARLGKSEGFVPLIGSGKGPPAPYLVMPFLDGGSLRDRLEKGKLTIQESLRVGLGVAAALGRAHEQGVIHRDLKPENVLFTATGQLLVGDLGLAKHFDHRTKGASASVDISETGLTAGTFGYSSPEQLRDAKHAGPPADVFAIGAILYECLTGKPPFGSEGLAKILERMLEGRIEPLAGLRPDAPERLVAAVERALATEPSARFQDARELERALAKVQAELDPTSSSPALGPGSLRPGSSGPVRPTVATVVVALAILLSVTILRWHDAVLARRTAEDELRAAQEEISKLRAREAASAREASRAVDRAVAAAEARVRADLAAKKKEARERAVELVAEGKRLCEQGDSTGSLARISEAMGLDPSLADAWAARGALRRGLRDEEGAFTDAARALELDPRSAEALELHADLVGKLRNDYETALGEYTRALELAPTDARPAVLNNRGLARSKKGDTEGALADYARSIELGYAPASFNRARIRQDHGDTAGAIADLERFLALSPNEPQSPLARDLLEKLKKIR